MPSKTQCDEKNKRMALQRKQPSIFRHLKRTDFLKSLTSGPSSYCIKRDTFKEELLSQCKRCVGDYV